MTIARGTRDSTIRQVAIGDWPTDTADQSPEDVPGPDKRAYFFFFAAFFLVAFFFAAFFFAITDSPPRCFVITARLRSPTLATVTLE